MTIRSGDYFRVSSPDRPVEPGLLAMIDRVACSSCRACASACPVGCIYEVEGEDRPGSVPYHAVDASRCIGCGLCFRLLGPSPGSFTDLLCPRDAIRMVANPNAGASPPALRGYYRGTSRTPPWPRIDEFGYQLFLAREVRARRGAAESHRALACLAEPHWSTGGAPFRIVEGPDLDDPALLYLATREGLELLERVFEGVANG